MFRNADPKEHCSASEAGSRVMGTVQVREGLNWTFPGCMHSPVQGTDPKPSTECSQGLRAHMWGGKGTLPAVQGGGGCSVGDPSPMQPLCTMHTAAQT